MLSLLQEHLHQIYKKAEIRDHQLLYLFLEITRACNLSCRHCGSDCGANTTARMLTTDSWIAFLDDLSRSTAPLPTLVLTGGEPILHPDFEKLIQTINRLRFRWGMVSNGYALDAAVLDVLTAYAIYSITISLDGSGPAHNWLRGKPDAHEKALRAIRRAAQSAIPLKDVVTCVHPRNIHELNTLANTLIDAGVTDWRLFRIFPAGRARHNHQLLLSHDQTHVLLDWIALNRDKYKRQGLAINYSCEGWLPFHLDRKIRKQPFFCRAGINIASILCDGTITGCTNNHSRFFEGTLERDNFLHLWSHGFKRFRDRTWVQSTECRRCPQIQRCQGGSLHLWREEPDKPVFCYERCYG